VFAARGRVFTGVCTEKVIFNKAFQELEPKKRNTGQDFPFIGDGVVHNHIKGRHPVARDDQELVLHFVDIPHLAPF